MRFSTLLWCCVAAAFCTSLASDARGQAATTDLLIQARELAREGRHAEAIPIYEAHLTEIERREGDDFEPLVFLLHELAVQHHAVGEAAEAEALYLRSLAVAEKYHGTRDSTLAPSLRGLAAVAAMRGRLQDAESYHRRVLEIQKSAAASRSDIARTYAELGVLRQLRGHPADAEELYRRALAADDDVLTETEVATVAGNLAALYARGERYGEAEQTYRQVLAIREKQLGPDHPDLIKVLLELASLQFRQRRYASAASSYERVLHLREPTGQDDLALSDLLSQLAATYRQLGRSAEAEAHFDLAKTILKAQCGDRERTKACRDATVIHRGLRNRPRDSAEPPPASGSPPPEETVAKVAATTTPARPVHRAQVAARQDRREAVEILERLQASHRDLVADLATRVVEVDLAERGVWHRVQIGEFPTASQAKALCSQLLRRGHDGCWVVATDGS